MVLYVFCSKEYGNRKLSGTYQVLSRKGRYGEDVYVNKVSNMFIYKIRNNIYVIGSRMGSASFRAYLKSSSLFTKAWNVIQSGRKLIEDVEMYVKDLTDDSNVVPLEEQNRDAMVVYSKYMNIHGGYRKQDDSVNGNLCYLNEEDNMYLYHIGPFWVIGPQKGASQFYMRSYASSSSTPDVADWTQCGISVKPYVSEETEETEDSVELYVDKVFNADRTSIGLEKFDNASWVRASHLQPSGAEMVLFHDVEPNDILQGGLGDCWLLCALAALAEFPNYFKDHIFMTDKVSPDGKYDLQLYDAKVRDWITVTIDDRIPCAEKKWYDTARPLFAQPHENEMYALLIEKAFAKMSGTYGKLAGGYPALAWMALTGCEDLHFWGKNSDGKSWTKRLAATDKIRENPWNFQGMWVKGTSHRNENDEMFEFLKECDKLNYVMGASIHGDIMEKARKDGLIERHAYSMIQVYEKDDIKLVQLRNPWGNNHEWNGDWSDKSRKWREHPEIAKELEWNNDPDGLFWIHWDDFVRVFHDIQIAAKTMVKKRGDFKKLIEEE